MKKKKSMSKKSSYMKKGGKMKSYKCGGTHKKKK